MAKKVQMKQKQNYNVSLAAVNFKPCHQKTRPEGYKTFSCSTKLDMKFILLINVKMPTIVIPRRSRRDIVLASSVRPFRPSVRPSVRTFCLSGTISQYLLVRFDSFLVQMISTMDSRYPKSLVKIDPLSLELLPLF